VKYHIIQKKISKNKKANTATELLHHYKPVLLPTDLLNILAGVTYAGEVGLLHGIEAIFVSVPGTPFIWK